MQVTAVRSGWLAPSLAVVVVVSSLLVRGGGFGSGSAAVSASGSYDWLQFDGDAQHSGNNVLESTISAGNVGTLAPAFRVSLPATADGAPAYLRGVATASGQQDLLFVTTKAGDILALDAHSGAPAWIQHNPAGSCHINNGGSTCYTTSSPAIDPGRQFVYSDGLDGKVHKYAVGNGNEVLAGAWPETTTLKAFDEKGSAALSIATASNGATYLYVANGGYPGDNGDYQGHLTAIDLSTGGQVVFNTLCSTQSVHFVEMPGSPDCSETQSAIWARPGVVYDAATNLIYFGTGNGRYAPASFDWGDSVLALSPDGTSLGGNPRDSYTPTNFKSLQNGDTDLGSTAPAILAAPTASNVPHLAVQGGKDGVLRLLNLDNLSGMGGPGHTGGEVSTIGVPQGGEILTQPASWVNPADGASWVFVANGNGISGLKLVVDGSGAPSLQAIWTDGNAGSSPLLANNVLYYATSGVLRAVDPTGGAPLWQGAIGGIHWESPIVANGVIYITDENGHLTAFTLPNQPPATNTPCSSVPITSAPTAVTGPFKSMLPIVLNGSCL